MVVYVFVMKVLVVVVSYDCRGGGGIFVSFTHIQVRSIYSYISVVIVVDGNDSGGSRLDGVNVALGHVSFCYLSVAAPVRTMQDDLERREEWTLGGTIDCHCITHCMLRRNKWPAKCFFPSIIPRR